MHKISVRCAFLLSIAIAVSVDVLAAIKSDEKSPRIAIIGGGIAGSASAYFLRELFGETAHIAVFEKSDRIGGRLSTLTCFGEKFESGGSIIHPDNLYMRRFAELLGLEKRSVSGGRFSLFDGKSIRFSTSPTEWETSLRLFWRYGWSTVRMSWATDDLLHKFKNIYSIQGNNNAFQTVEDLLQSITGDNTFYRLTQITLQEYLVEQGLSKDLIDELITAVTRINYGQSTEINALAGMIAIAGVAFKLWAVKGGNWKVCDGLLNVTHVVVNKNEQIIDIIKEQNPADIQKPVYYLRSVNAVIDVPFDVVIMAFPLEIRENYVTCNECENWPVRRDLPKFHVTVATFVNGTPSTDVFQTPSNTYGTMEEPDIFFNSIGKQSSVDKERKDIKSGNISVWKIFSRTPLTDEQKQWLFHNHTECNEVQWLAYPHYTVPQKFLSFVLDHGVFYANAIEWAASAMEMSCLAAKNVALLTERYLNLTKPRSHEGNQHEEL